MKRRIVSREKEEAQRKNLLKKSFCVKNKVKGDQRELKRRGQTRQEKA